MKNIFSKIRYRLGLSAVERGAIVRGNVRLGNNVFIGRNAQLIADGDGEIAIGDFCEIHSGAILAAYGGNITIGNHVGINPYSVLYGHGSLFIGDKSLIASHCVIIPANHNFSEEDIDIQDQGVTAKGIIIENNVWLGSGVKVLDGIKIESGSVIGAGSVVTKNIQANSIYAGNPAKFIKKRF